MSVPDDRRDSAQAEDATPWLVAVLDPDARVEHVNRPLAELAGRPADELRGGDWFEEVVPERRRAEARAGFRAAVDGAAPARRIELVLGGDGSEHPVEWRYAPLGDGRGGVAAVLAIGVGASALDRGDAAFARASAFAGDVEEALDAAGLRGTAPPVDSALRESEERFANAFRHSRTGMAIRHIARDVIIDVNPSYERLSGYGYDELVGSNPSELGLYADPADREVTRSQADRGERVEGFEFDMRTKSGAVRRVVMALDPIVLGGDPCVLASFLDVTEQRRAEEELARSERHLRQILDGVLAYVGVLSPEGRLLYANEPAFASSGVPAAAAAGRLFWELPVFVEADVRERVRDAALAAAAGRVARERIRAEFDGVARTVDITFRPVGDPDQAAAEVLAFGVDVTDLLVAEAALGQSEERLREAVRVAAIGIFDHDHRTDTIFWSPEQRAIYGLRDDEEPTLALYLERLHPDDREAMAAAVQRAHDPAGDGRFDVDHRIVRPDGSVRWLTTMSQTLFEGEGDERRPVRSVGAVQDTTDRALAQLELRESRERYRALFEQAGVGVAETETGSGRILMANTKLAQMLGGSVEELEGMTVEDFIHPEERETVGEQRAALARRNAGRYEVQRRLRRLDGGDVWASVAVVALPRRSGQPPHEVAVLVDVTGRHRAELALLESNRRLLEIVDSALEAIVTVDEEQRIRVFSRTAETLFGYDAADVVGLPLDVLLPERHREVHRAHVASYGASGDTSRPMGGSLRVTARRADGSEFPIEATISRSATADGTILTVFIRDTSERERSRELQEQLLQQLEEARRMEAIGTLASGIAHDFNNILGAILGNAELGLQQRELPPAARDRFGDVTAAAKRGAQLVDQILAFARHDREARAAISLGPLVEESARLVQVGLPANVRLTVACAGDLPAVVASEAEIHQVVTNLCVNAVQAIGEGAGTVSVRVEAVRLGEDARDTHADLRPGPYVRLSVADSGPGMEVDVRDRIFEPFFTTKEVGRGTGLGLSVVHGIVRACGGASMVSSRPGEGTTFSLYFPASGDAIERPPAAEQGPIREAPVAGTHVLYVDDEQALAAFGERVLGMLGYRVTALTDPLEALAAVEADGAPYDLVVADVTMPGLSGVELARRIAAARPDLPVALMSGFVTDELRARAAEIGVRHVISKPMALAELAAIVAELTPPAE